MIKMMGVGEVMKRRMIRMIRVRIAQEQLHKFLVLWLD